MTEITKRKMMRKRLKNPSDASNYVDVPVIVAVPFMVNAEQAQERILYFNNTDQSKRAVRVQTVTGVDGVSTIDVERPQKIYIMDTASQGQEIVYHYVNDDPPPIQMDGSNDVRHARVHYVRYFKNNDTESSVYVDMELIDILRVAEAGQEWVHHLKHPELGDAIDAPEVPYAVTVGYCDPDLELMAEAA